MKKLQLWFICAFAYLTGAFYLGAARLAGAVTIVGGSGYQWGLEAAETGINVESFEVRYYPAVNEKLQGITAEPIIRAQSAKFSRDITFSGEVNAGTGIMAFALATALTFANDVATFGDGTGTVLLDEMTETQSRGWRAVSGRASSDPLTVAA